MKRALVKVEVVAGAVPEAVVAGAVPEEAEAGTGAEVVEVAGATSSVVRSLHVADGSSLDMRIVVLETNASDASYGLCRTGIIEL
jgi:hypothetical protein